jgi:hypothetical protein
MTMGIAVLRTTTHRNDSWFEGLISICGRKADMNKISGLCTRDRFSSFAPANLAKNVRDRLLFPAMMNSRPDPGSTSNSPPQMGDAIPSAGAIAARRSEPGVCAVARSNSVGLTMWIAAEELMASRIGLNLQPGA